MLVRTSDELIDIAEGNPFLAHEADRARLHVVFLDRPPEPGAAAQLDPERSPPDRFSLNGREISPHLPNGAGRSKLTIDYVERRLEVKATARNWNTLTKLLALARSEIV